MPDTPSLLQRYGRSVWENFAVSSIVPATCLLALFMAALLTFDVQRTLALAVLRVDGFALIMYHVLWRKKDMERLRRRALTHRAAGPVGPSANSRSHHLTTLMASVVFALAVLIVLSFLGKVF